QIVLNQRKMAIERNDEFLGRLLYHLDLESTMVLIISPNPHKEMLSENNFGLTPVLIHNPNQPGGLVTSSTTRRTGLITNADILPTIFSYLEADFISASNGTNIKMTANNSINIINQELELFKNLRAARSPLHLLFISLILLTFVI